MLTTEPSFFFSDSSHAQRGTIVPQSANKQQVSVAFSQKTNIEHLWMERRSTLLYPRLEGYTTILVDSKTVTNVRLYSVSRYSFQLQCPVLTRWFWTEHFENVSWHCILSHRPRNRNILGMIAHLLISAHLFTVPAVEGKRGAAARWCIAQTGSASLQRFLSQTSAWAMGKL